MPSTTTRTRLERQPEGLRQLLPHAGRELRRHVDGQPVGAPVGDDRVRLQAAVRLHLRAVLALDDDVGLREALRDVAARCAGRAAHIALQRQALAGAESPMHGLAGAEAASKTRGAAGIARSFHVGDEGQRPGSRRGSGAAPRRPRRPRRRRPRPPVRRHSAGSPRRDPRAWRCATTARTPGVARPPTGRWRGCAHAAAANAGCARATSRAA